MIASNNNHNNHNNHNSHHNKTFYPTGMISVHVSVKRYPENVRIFLLADLRIIGWEPMHLQTTVQIVEVWAR
jgi:hypothetical protein